MTAWVGDCRAGLSGPRIMVDAHMDELGGIVRRITPDGYLTMQMLGGWLDQALVDQRWTIIGSKGRCARLPAFVTSTLFRRKSAPEFIRASDISRHRRKVRR